MSETPEHFEEFIIQIVKRILPNNPFRIKTAPGAKWGEGFLGDTFSVMVELSENDKDEEKQIHLFFKKAPRNKVFRKVLRLHEVYQREVLFYKSIHPIFNELCLKYMKTQFDVTPNCLFSSTQLSEEVLVFENITLKGYKMIDSLDCFDDKHLKIVLKKFSFLHACGFILKQEKPDFFQDLSKEMDEMMFKICAVYELNRFLDYSFNVIKDKYGNAEDKLILEHFDKIKTEVINSLSAMNKIAEFPTIVHADCWLNNIMFKYNDDSKELQDIKVLDFQMSTVNSPIFDVLHIFYCNASTNEIIGNYKYYQDYYHESLSSYIFAMNGDPQVLYPREEFQKQWKTFRYYGLLFAILALRGLMADPTSIPDVIEMANQNRLGEVFICVLPDEGEFCRRIKLIVQHFIMEKML